MLILVPLDLLMLSCKLHTDAECESKALAKFRNLYSALHLSQSCTTFLLWFIEYYIISGVLFTQRKFKSEFKVLSFSILSCSSVNFISSFPWASSSFSFISFTTNFCFSCCFRKEASVSNSASFIFFIDNLLIDWFFRPSRVRNRTRDLWSCLRSAYRSRHHYLFLFLQLVIHRMLKVEQFLVNLIKPQIISSLLIVIKLPMIFTIHTWSNFSKSSHCLNSSENVQVLFSIRSLFFSFQTFFSVSVTTFSFYQKDLKGICQSCFCFFSSF